MNILDYISISEILAENENVKHIDLFNNQYIGEAVKKSHPVKYPAVYIECNDVDVEMGTHHSNEASITFRLHIVQNIFKDTANVHKMTDTDKLATLKAFKTAENIAQTVNNKILTTSMSKTKLERVEMDHNHDQVMVTLYTYTYQSLYTSTNLTSMIDKVITDFKVTGKIKPLINIQ